ncbi:hypothetical protein JQ628_01060 [Bradyrhizobium lablabi]|uniref:hypothetical protein n=1 Tax=Bradyrhizobium lablabi TaxID=722472 RepID=UPI001BAC6A5E|nr:hypothetical protein [Bradyrhizobium lablabi]MBR1120084.1 hypothetical protein [Bradyrhizobium lablabi]
MSDSRSVIFGDLQYQISKPIQHPNGYYYQRVRQIDRNGNLVGDGEVIVRSSGPDSQAGLFDPNGGRQSGYAVARSVFDLGRVALGVGLGNSRMIGGGAASAVKGASQGFQLPDFLRGEYHAWPGTDEPWDQNTLNSDSRPNWQPGPSERLLYGVPREHRSDRTRRIYKDEVGLSASHPMSPQAEAESGGFGGRPPRVLSGRFVGQPPASWTGQDRAEDAPRISDNMKYTGGLLGRINALAGDDPQGQAPFELSPYDEAWHGAFRSTQPWFVRGR